MDNNSSLKTIHASEQTIDSILNRLNNVDSITTAKDRRQEQRFAFRNHSTVVYFLLPGDVAYTGFKSPTLNISQTGIALLHDAFVPPQSECDIRLHKLNSALFSTHGRVARCTLIAGNLYEVYVSLNTELEPFEFVVPTTIPVSE